MARPVAVDLFAGAGGLSLGFEQAGFDVAAAVEVDPVHAAVHEFNFPECAVFPRSVVGLGGAEIAAALRERGISRVDAVFGGAPCQGFSLIGARQLDDPRNRLVAEFVRLVRELEANYFVFENVRGITVGRHRMFLDELIGTFSASGYDVLLPWRILNAANYGVPQERERLFLLGCRRGLRLPAYPTATTRRAGTSGTADGPDAGPSCHDALDDIPDAELYRELAEAGEAAVVWGRPGAYGAEMRCLSNTAWHHGYIREGWDRTLLTNSQRTEHSETSAQRFAMTEPGTVEPVSRFFRLAAGGVSNTLRAGTDSARGAFTSPRPIHYRYPRCVTVREMARLHGFPDWFRFHGTKWHGARQIGNSVPPPLARAVAGAVMQAMGAEPCRPARTVRLGNPNLLAMDMAEASGHFGIRVPIAGRNRRRAAAQEPGFLPA